MNSYYNYSFGDFTLTSDGGGTLLHKNKLIDIAPKEFGVLLALAESQGRLITKDEIMEKVWNHIEVSEESLTRCIYVLRCILKEKDNEDFIKTVYGKGYRFFAKENPINEPIVLHHSNQEQEIATLAILPFHMNSKAETWILHDYLIENLSPCAALAIKILPSALTRDCNNYMELASLLELVVPDFYLSGGFIQMADGENSLRVELVRSVDHTILYRDVIKISNSRDNILMALAIILVHCLPKLNLGMIEQISSSVFDLPYLGYILGRHKLSSYKLANIKAALACFSNCLKIDAGHSMLYTSMAECYFALSHLQGKWRRKNLRTIQNLTYKALEINPNNALALAIRGVTMVLDLRYSEASRLLILADSLGNRLPGVDYYNAWNLCLRGNKDKAYEYIEYSISISSNVSAKLLKLLLLVLKNEDTNTLSQELKVITDRDPTLARVVIHTLNQNYQLVKPFIISDDSDDEADRNRVGDRVVDARNHCLID